MGRFRLESPAPGCREPVILGAAIVLARRPLRVDPAVLLELVKRRVQRALPHPQLFVRHLADSLRDRPSVKGLEREHAKNEEVERALDEIGWLAYGLFSCQLLT